MKGKKLKNLTRLVACLLACMTVLVCFVSCSNGDGKDTDSSVNTLSSGGDGTRLPLSVAQEDNGGRVFTIYMNSQHVNDLEGDGTTRVSQIRRELNIAVEDLLNIELEYILEAGNWSERSTFNSKIEQMVMAGESEYDMVWANMSSTLPTTMLKGLYMDVNSIEALELDSPWYIEDMQEEYALNDKLYGIIGDASFTLYEEMEVVFYNKQLLDEYHLEDPMEKALSGEWYMQDLFTSAKNIVSTDADTFSGEVKDDNVGLVWDCVAGRYITTAWDLPLVERDAAGRVSIPNTPSEQLISVFDYIYSWMENSGGSILTPGGRTVVPDNFKTGKVAYELTYLGMGSSIKEAQFEYSIVPVPKISENQEDYVTAVGSGVASIMVLKNVKDAELTGKVIESLSYYSHYDGVPQFYEIILKLQYAKDAQFGEVLDMIRENAKLPFTVVFSTELKPRFTEIFQMNEEYRHTYVGASLTTFWAENISTWQSALKGIYDAADTLG